MTSSALNYLVAARRFEIDELEQLARTGDLVGAVGHLVHALQRERGLSNVLLASNGSRFAAQRLAQIGDSLRLERAARDGFEQLLLHLHRNGARLFSRIAWVVQGLDALPALRRRIGALDIGADDATAAYVKLIAGLLAVVFEAADGATDPAISRALAALFNFMQAKEFAGQERACGGAAFAAGRIDAERQRQWRELIAAQERCCSVFADFADSDLRDTWRDALPAAEVAEIERLRRIGCAAAPGAALDPDLLTAWFDSATLRIDAMQAVDEQLRSNLRLLCLAKIDAARAEADAHQALLEQLPLAAEAAPVFFDFGMPKTPYGPQMERSIFDMLQDQSRRLQTISDELDAVREALNERKLVERAKGLLMAHRRLSEPDAHRMLRQTAMNQNRRIVDVAESVLSMAEYLPGMQPSGA